MSTLDAIRDAMPDAAKDMRLNLTSVLEQSTLDLDDRWGVAVASAIAARSPQLVAALADAARTAGVAEGALDDARTAAVVMGMTNVFYRFRHLVGKDGYQQRPPRLRMNRLAAPQSSKRSLELFSLAVSAINACEACVRSHEAVVVHEGLTEDQVIDAVRIASVVHASAVALELPATAAVGT